MNHALKISFRGPVLALFLGLFGAAFADGGIVERPDMETKFPGRIYFYSGERSPASNSSIYETADEVFSIPRLHRPGSTSGMRPQADFRLTGQSGGPAISGGVGSERIKCLSRALDEGGMAYEVIAYDHYCYVGTTNSLSVYDVIDPAAPVLVHEIKEPVGTLVQHGTLLAGAMGCQGDFVLFDLVNPAAPVEISRVSLPENFAFDYVSLSGSLAVAMGWGYDDLFGNAGIMQVIDISDPYAPIVESTMLGLGDYYRSVLIEQNTIYLMVQYEGIAIFDVTDPLFIKQIGFIAAGEIQDGLVYEGGNLFCSGTNGLEILDVTDPASPVLIGQLGPGYTAELRVSGDYVYLADDDDRAFRVVDISDPANPQLVLNYPAYGRAYQLDLLGDKIFIADMVYGLLVVDITTPASPALLSMTATGAFPRGIDVEGSQAVVATNTALLHTLDVSDPFAPQVQGVHMPAPDAQANNTLWTLAVDLEGDIAVAGHWNYGIHVYDVSDPALPEKPGALKIKGIDVAPVALLGDVVYTGSTELLVIDISDPANPVQSGTGISVPDDVWSVKVSGDTAYMSGYSEVVIIDITNPLTPVELNRFTLHDWIKGIAIENNLLGVFWEWYGTGYSGGIYTAGFELFDVTDPMNPAPLGSLEIPEYLYFTRPGGTTLTVENGRFFIASYARLVAIDAIDPLNPTIAAMYPEASCFSPSWCGSEGVIAKDGLVYLTGHGGLEILRFLDVGIFLTPESTPTAVKQGESFGYQMKVENFTSKPQTVFAWVETIFPGATDVPTAAPVWVTLEPGKNVIHMRGLEVPKSTPLGTYHLNAHVSIFPGVEMDSDRIAFEVVSAD